MLTDTLFSPSAPTTACAASSAISTRSASLRCLHGYKSSKPGSSCVSLTCVFDRPPNRYGRGQRRPERQCRRRVHRPPAQPQHGPPSPARPGPPSATPTARPVTRATRPRPPAVWRRPRLNRPDCAAEHNSTQARATPPKPKSRPPRDPRPHPGPAATSPATPPGPAAARSRPAARTSPHRSTPAASSPHPSTQPHQTTPGPQSAPPPKPPPSPPVRPPDAAARFRPASPATPALDQKARHRHQFGRPERRPARLAGAAPHNYRPPVRQPADQHPQKAADERRKHDRQPRHRSLNPFSPYIHLPAIPDRRQSTRTSDLPWTATSRRPPRTTSFRPSPACFRRAGSATRRTIDRARRVAAESGQRLDLVLLQLGLVGERDLADGYATLLGTRVANPARYPVTDPLLPDRLTSRFLRTARAMPVAIEHGQLVVACADPLDRFTPAAIQAATGMVRPARSGRAAGTRGGVRPAVSGDRRRRCRPPPRGRGPARGGCRAAQRSRVRGTGDPAGQPDHRPCGRDGRVGHPYRAVRGPPPRPLPLRRRAAGGRKPAAAPRPRHHVADQNHGAAGHCRAPATAGRADKTRRARCGNRLPSLHHPLALGRDGGDARARPECGRVRLREAWFARHR